MLQSLGVEPLFDLDLRLGEGTGALLAYPLLRAACAMLGEMATFASAGISQKQDGIRTARTKLPKTSSNSPAACDRTELFHSPSFAFVVATGRRPRPRPPGAISNFR